ncbi:MAG: hypothetical protein IJS19_02925 [Muribaculaceae bacterium]|nr:hypothetical protein [Muribaculaceae bacterium]
MRDDSAGEWDTVCRCRCDRNGTKEFKTDNGGVYRPDFHIVCEGNVELEAGMRVRCLDNGEVKAEGVVYRPQTYNLLPYTEVWI